MIARRLPIAAVILLIVDLVTAHISLTFPPARQYAFDFLDNTRTGEPCGGMKKGVIKTTLPAGQRHKITWHLGYAHQGGIRLELYDGQDRKIQDLTQSSNSGFVDGNGDIYLQEVEIEIAPDLSCQDCTIRLVRQALEWKNYRFHSCADVDIVDVVTYNALTSAAKCSGHGTASGSDCNCDRTYFGDRCQYKNDCDSLSDCNGVTCVAINGGTALPKKQCFCPAGMFGRNCDRTSSIKDGRASFDPKKYELVSGHGVDFYWRMIEESDEVEGVIVGKNTNSYVAVGWRPSEITASCKSFPVEGAVKDRRLHPMDCMDIVVGTVHGDGRSRVGDYYTRDRSTPQPDSFYGGADDLSGAEGWVSDGNTHVMFRKKARKNGAGDHDFAGRMTFIWAHGRSDDAFYAPNELKYHGGSGRGVGSIVAPSSAALTLKSSALVSLLSLILLTL